jgi:hypothetical protein
MAEPKGGDEELSGTVFMSGSEVLWAGPDAVLGQQQDEDEDVFEGEGEETVATGEEYTPPQSDPTDED